jgi:hypothetical protein
MSLRTNGLGKKLVSMLLIFSLLMWNVADVILFYSIAYAQGSDEEQVNTEGLNQDETDVKSANEEDTKGLNTGADSDKPTADAQGSDEEQANTEGLNPDETGVNGANEEEAKELNPEKEDSELTGEQNGNYIYLSENTMPAEISESNVFYVATNSADLRENEKKIYLFKIGRGGDTSEAASVTLKISDFTAKYGKDYQIRIHHNCPAGEVVQNPPENQSLVEMITGADDLREIPMGGDEEAAQILLPQTTNSEKSKDSSTNRGSSENGTEIEEDVQDEAASSKDIVDNTQDNQSQVESGADSGDLRETPAGSDGNEEITAPPAAQGTESENQGDGTTQEPAEKTMEAEGDVQDETDPPGTEQEKAEAPEGINSTPQEPNNEDVDEVIKENPATVQAATKNVDADTLKGAKQLYTGIESDRMPMSSTGDMVEQLQQMGDWITTAVTGATLKLDFGTGEREKYLEIETIDNDESDGDRSFMIVLSETAGNVSNSPISNAMFTIIDDEEEELAELSFKCDSIEADDEKAVIEISRTGAINSTVGATITTEEISAVAGRDFSPVQASVVFPFGIKARTLEIPVRRDYITETVSFKVLLEKPIGCEISGSGEAEVKINPAGLNHVSLMSTEAGSEFQLLANTVSSRVLGNALDLSSPAWAPHAGGNSKNYYSNGVYELSGDDHARVFWGWDPNNQNKTFYNYSGLAIDWQQDSGKPAYSTTRLEANMGNADNAFSWADLVNTETERWGRSTHDYYYPKAGVSTIAIHQNDRGGIWGKQIYNKIYSIKPILRPFEVSLQAAAPLKFLDENGNLLNNAYYTSARLENTDADGKAIKFTGDTIQISATNGGMAKLVGVNIVKEGKQPLRVVNVNKGATAATISFTPEFTSAYQDYITFSANGNQGFKGAFTLQPVFDYYNAKVRVYKHDKGYFNLSGGHNFNISQAYQDFTYHLGDTIKLSTTVNSLYATDYKATGVKYAYKHNAMNSDQDWGTWGYNKNNNTTYSYLIKNEYTEISPVIEKKDNKIVVRVKKTDLNSFNPNYGIFNPGANAGRADNGTYWDYTVVNPNDTFYKKDYTFLAKTINENNVPIWKETKKGKSFSGNVFYYNAWDTKEDNIIELSLSGNKQYYSLQGSMYYNNYNLATGRSGEAWLAAWGGIVAANGASGMVAESGAFQTTPFMGVKNSYTRYMAACDGRAVYQEYLLPADGAVTDISVSIIDTEGNQSTKTYNTMVLNLGSVIIPVDSKDTPVFSGVTATNAGHVSVGSASIYINDTSTKMDAQISNDGISYVKANGDVATENVTAVDFLIYDGKTNALKKTLPAAKSAGVWTASSIFKLNEPTICAPGDKLFVQMTTDKASGAAITNYDDQGNEIQTDPESLEALQKTIYTPVFSGYMFVTTAAKEPVTQSFNLPTNAKFLTLPLIGEMNAVFKIANISLAIEELPDGITRLKFGYVVTKKFQSENAGKADNDVDYDSMSYKEGIASSFATAFNKDASFDESSDMSSLGAQQWGIYPVVGVYIDFGLSYITDADGIDTNPQFEFMGGGVFLGGIATYKVAWYSLLPVVFIPCYFGVAGQLSLILDIGASASPDSTLTYDGIETTGYELNKEFEFDAALRACAYVQIYAGVGLCGTIGVRGGGQVDANYIYYPTVMTGYSQNGLGLTFSLKLWVDAFLFSIPIPLYSFDELKFGYFKEVSENKKNTSLMAVNEEELSKDRLEIRLKEFNDQPSTWLPSGSGMQLMGGFKQKPSITLNENGYDRPDAQLLDLGAGNTLLVFLDKDTSRDDLEKTVLKYSVYSNGSWNEPLVIQNDGTADFQPNLCEAGDNVMISWVSSDPSVEKTGDANQYLGCLEIYTALLNKSTLELGPIERLTEDGYYDYEPAGMYDDKTGDRAVYYIKSSIKDSFVASVDSTGNDCVIVYMLYDAGQGKWLRDYYYDNEVASPEAAQILIEKWKGQRFLSSPIDELNMTDPLIFDFNGTSYNGIGVYAYTIDKDNSKDTHTDRELFVQVYDFDTHKTYKPIRITNDDVSDTMPQLVRRGSGENAATYLFWLQEDKVLRYINLSDLVKNGIESNGTIKEDYELNYGTVSMTSSLDTTNRQALGTYQAAVDDEGNMYVIWQENVSDPEAGTHCVELYATAFIGEDLNLPDESEVIKGGSWAPPYRLTYSNLYNDEPAISVDNKGNITIVHNQYAMKFSEDENRPVLISDLKLMATGFEPCSSVEVTDIKFSSITPTPGSVITVSALVANNGLTVADGYTVSFYESRKGTKGDLVSIQESTTRLIPGSTEHIEFAWTLPEDINGLALCAVAGENKLTGEFAFTGPELKVTPVYEISGADLYQGDDGFYADMLITNTGNAPAHAGDTLKVRYNLPYASAQSLGIENEIFAEAEIGELAAGNSKDYHLKLEIPAAAFEKYKHMECYIAVYDSKGENILSNELDKFLVIKKPADLRLNNYEASGTIAMKSGETTELNLSYGPVARFSAGEVIYSVENPEIAGISGSTLTALSPGTTTLYALVSPYGARAEYEISVSKQSGGSSGSSSSSSPETTKPVAFNDISQHWAQESIQKAAEKGILKGYGDGSFKPNAAIKRSEFLSILYNSALTDVNTQGDLNLTDMDKKSWYYEYVKWGVNKGISKGYRDNTFGGDKPITREEMAVMLSRFLSLTSKEFVPKYIMKFTDEQDISHWAREDVEEMSSFGILKGNPDGSYLPKNHLNRAEAATIMMSIVE